MVRSRVELALEYSPVKRASCFDIGCYPCRVNPAGMAFQVVGPGARFFKGLNPDIAGVFVEEVNQERKTWHEASVLREVGFDGRVIFVVPEPVWGLWVEVDWHGAVAVDSRPELHHQCTILGYSGNRVPRKEEPSER